MGGSEILKFFMRPYHERQALISPEGMEMIKRELEKLPFKQQENFQVLLKIKTIVEPNDENTPTIILKAKKRNAEEWVRRIHMMQIKMKKE